MRTARASKWSCVVLPTKQYRKLVKTDKKLVTGLCKEWGSGHRLPYCCLPCFLPTVLPGFDKLKISSSKVGWSMFNPCLMYTHGMNESLVLNALGHIIHRASLSMNMQLHVNRLETHLDFRKGLDQSCTGRVSST